MYGFFFLYFTTFLNKFCKVKDQHFKKLSALILENTRFILFDFLLQLQHDQFQLQH